ncbi:hypothetical protein [Mesorhizobium sp. 128a]
MASFTPQAWKIIRTLDPKSILAPMNALTVFGFALWLTFGLMKDESPIFILQRTVLPKSQERSRRRRCRPAKALRRYYELISIGGARFG